jgi:hypothetical protein
MTLYRRTPSYAAVRIEPGATAADIEAAFAQLSQESGYYLMLGEIWQSPDGTRFTTTVDGMLIDGTPGQLLRFDIWPGTTLLLSAADLRLRAVTDDELARDFTAVEE